MKATFTASRAVGPHILPVAFCAALALVSGRALSQGAQPQPGAPLQAATPDTIATAKGLLRQRDYGAASELLDRLARSNPSPEAWNLLAFARNRQGSWQAALDAAHASLKLAPSSDLCRGERGTALYNLGRNKEAEADLERYLRFNRNDSSAHYYRGLALEKLGRFPEARASMHMARLNNSYLSVLVDVNIAMLDARQGHFKEALRPLREIDAAFKNDDTSFTKARDAESRGDRPGRAQRRGPGSGQIASRPAIKDGSRSIH
jgi:Flp pilus assembly protein TadD